jgi:hypothetical protein
MREQPKVSLLGSRAQRQCEIYLWQWPHCLLLVIRRILQEGALKFLFVPLSGCGFIALNNMKILAHSSQQINIDGVQRETGGLLGKEGSTFNFLRKFADGVTCGGNIHLGTQPGGTFSPPFVSHSRRTRRQRRRALLLTQAAALSPPWACDGVLI